MATRTSPSERLSPWTNSGKERDELNLLAPVLLGQAHGGRGSRDDLSHRHEVLLGRQTGEGAGDELDALLAGLCGRAAAAGRRPWRFFFDMPVSLPAAWRPTEVDGGPSPAHDAPHGSSPPPVSPDVTGTTAPPPHGVRNASPMRFSAVGLRHLGIRVARTAWSSRLFKTALVFVVITVFLTLAQAWAQQRPVMASSLTQPEAPAYSTWQLGRGE